MAKSKQKDFTQAINRLDEIITKLESPDLDLEEALVLIDEGVGLHKYCREKLKLASTKIKTILKDQGVAS